MTPDQAAALAHDLFAAAAVRDRIPAIAWGLVHDGRLVASGGAGQLPGGRTPDADDVFRIASMSKSFTAAAVLLLRDDGRLRLDDPVASWVPAAATVGNDGPPITIRDLLTMTGGLPTDDPWGDRQESLAAEDWHSLVADGLRFAWPNRSRWEYSNAGYALLGSVVSAVTGEAFVHAVEEILLSRLELPATCYDYRHVAPDRLVSGFRLGRNGLLPEPPVTPGAFSAMGGLHSSVRDLATWVSGFTTAWRDEAAGTGHPLSRWSRLEMQATQRHISTSVLTPPAPPAAASMGYGFGLWNTDVDGVGQVVAHSGGYPGYGSHMRWHVPSGWGVVALGNRSYAPVAAVAAEVLWRLVDGDGPVTPPVTAWPETLAAMDFAETLLSGGRPGTGPAFAPNMDLDLPAGERFESMADVRDLVGAFTRDPDTVEVRTPAHIVWRVTGDATAELEVMMAPTRVPLIQRISVTLVTAPRPTDASS